jgi:hypothetical protein
LDIRCSPKAPNAATASTSSQCASTSQCDSGGNLTFALDCHPLSKQGGLRGFIPWFYDWDTRELEAQARSVSYDKSWISNDPIWADIPSLRDFSAAKRKGDGDPKCLSTRDQIFAGAELI